jgi:hypothetical protein
METNLQLDIHYHYYKDKDWTGIIFKLKLNLSTYIFDMDILCCEL